MFAYKPLLENFHNTSRGWTLDVTDNWKQGRTLYGGLTAGLCYEAVVRDHPNLPPLRSLQIGFIGPVTENPLIATRLLRQGRNVTAIQADMYNGEQLVATATFLFGQSRESMLTVEYPAPDASSPADTAPFFPEAAAAFLPPFTQNFDIRLIEGSRPMMGAKRGYMRTWARHKDAASREGLSSFITIGDVMPPAALPMFTQMGPVSSMNWQVNILKDVCETKDGWWHIELALTAAQGGYSSQIMRYWTPSGELFAEATQSVTIFI
jgi:acyl-CoA thioesterase